MAANLLFSCVKKLFPSRSRRDRLRLSRVTNRTVPAWRPVVEVLEDRITPSNFNVTDLADTAGNAGDVTLRYAVTNAQNGDTINFSVTGTITLGSTLPTIANSVTITGPGAGSLAVSGGNANQ